MNFKNTAVIVFLLTISVVSAQDYRFGKVSKEELKETIYRNDSTVDAAVLYRELKVHYPYRQGEGFNQFVEVFERIKIYNPEGYRFATIKNKLYDESSEKEEQIEGLKAYTYSLESGKVKDVKLKKDGIFEEKINQFWKSHKFTMPNLKEGSIIEYTYRIESPFMSIDDVNLQYDIPIKKSKVEIFVPEYFIFNKTINPKAAYHPEIVESSMNRTEVLTKSQVTLTNGSGYQTGTNSKNPQLKFTQNKIEIIGSNIPALKREMFVDNINNYRSKLLMEYVAYKNSDGNTRYFSKTWEDVSKTIYNSSDFGAQLSKEGYFKDDVDVIVSNSNAEKEIIAKIYSLVKKKVKWNGFTGYKSNENLRKVYKEGSGNVGDINLMLVAMLRYAGIAANPVLLSTRANGIPLAPTLDGFNYVICRVKLEEGYVLLDGTSNYSTANILPERAINWQGRVIDDRGFSDWISLKPETVSDKIYQMNINIQEDLSIDGKLREKLTNYLALDFREDYAKVKPESIIAELEKEKGYIVIENLDIKNKTDLSKPILISYDFKLDNAVDEIGGKLYFSPLLFFGNNTNAFVQDTRVYPIDLIYPQNAKYRISINLPEGYEVESLPGNAKFVLNTTEGEFSYVIVPNGKSIQLVISSNLKNTLILPKGYPEFKKFVQLSSEKKAEKIVLKKV
ncbi:transglutaminase-like domain-containing protein [Lacinutrix jangbogonensis]|uniref:transglutaminase-like domain-containing protein n=1 Tax=Lacinutrix jangbogonensis TaxID=1469557 RepID=UPI00053F28E0|nr:transglutaminase-like domain-containing protein [Lacinutrix jangbogonensis]